MNMILASVLFHSYLFLIQGEGWMGDEESAGCLAQAIHIDFDPKIASVEVHIF
jgi:hypothetical protein